MKYVVQKRPNERAFLVEHKEETVSHCSMIVTKKDVEKAEAAYYFWLYGVELASLE